MSELLYLDGISSPSYAKRPDLSRLYCNFGSLCDDLLMKSLQQRPQSVKQAVKLLYFGVAIGGVRMLHSGSQEVQQPNSLEPQTLLLMIFSILLVTSIYIFMVYLGKNWARISFAGLSICGLPLSFQESLESYKINTVDGSLGFVGIFFFAVSLFLLFRSDARKWFNPNL